MSLQTAESPCGLERQGVNGFLTESFIRDSGEGSQTDTAHQCSRACITLLPFITPFLLRFSRHLSSRHLPPVEKSTAHTHTHVSGMCSLTSLGIFCHLINWWYKWDMISDLHPSHPLFESHLGAHAQCFGARLWEFCRLTRCAEAQFFSLFQRWNVWSHSRNLKTNKSLSSVNLSLCPQSCLWVGALWGLRVRGASETSGECCSPSRTFHSLFLLSVCGRDASSRESSVSGPEAEQGEGAWLPMLESVKCVVHCNAPCTHDSFLCYYEPNRRCSVSLGLTLLFCMKWTHNLSAFLTFRLWSIFRCANIVLWCFATKKSNLQKVICSICSDSNCESEETFSSL